MKLLRAHEVAALDAAAAAAGVELRALMRRAAAGVAGAAERLQPEAERVVVLAGPGHNGGDGYLSALLLAERGKQITVLELTDAPASALTAWARGELLEHAPGLPLQRIAAADALDLRALLSEADLVVDALFGAGLNRPVDRSVAALFEAIHASATPVLAVDLPSGLHADRAALPGAVLNATWTLQLSAAKPASFLPPARERFGAWWVDDLDLASELLARHSRVEAIGRSLAGAALPRRRSDDHKYRAGAVVVVGGSARYPGASDLAARAALRAGAGYVTLASDATPPSWPELVRLAARDWPQARADVALIGPGWEGDRGELLTQLHESRTPRVLDGGALHPDLVLRGALQDPPRTILTPHAGEAAALLGSSADAVAADPLAAAERLAERTGAAVVLKGPSSVIATPEGGLRIAVGGPAALAVAGSGDVLAGIVAALLAAQIAGQRHAPRPTAELADLLAGAVVLHAEAARVALEQLAGGDPPPSGGLIPSDLIDALPRARGRLEAAGASAQANPGGW